jgi:hypothetical protein
MIEQLHVDQSEGLLNPKGSEPVVKAGFEYAGWKIVGKDSKRSYTMKGKADQQPDINYADFHTADVQHTPANDLLAVMEEDNDKLLL